MTAPRSYSIAILYGPQRKPMYMGQPTRTPQTHHGRTSERIPTAGRRAAYKLGKRTRRARLSHKA